MQLIVSGLLEQGLISIRGIAAWQGSLSPVLFFLDSKMTAK
jgi:hypothetical protein